MRFLQLGVLIICNGAGGRLQEDGMAAAMQKGVHKDSSSGTGRAGLPSKATWEDIV